MKRIISLFLSLTCLLGLLLVSACDNSSKCKNCSFGEQTVYKEVDGVVKVGKLCEVCGFIDAERTIEVDYVAQNSNEVSTFQTQAEKKGGSCSIVLKAGEYENVYLINRMKGSTYLVFETGVQVVNVNVYADADNVTLENAHFYSDPETGKGGGVSFGTSGVVSAEGERNYMRVTIKNCSFYGNTNIARNWAAGMVEDLIVENCSFTNSVNATKSVFTPIFIAEVGGNTIIRNCTFDGAEYGMIRFGHYYNRGVTGTLLIENNIFKNSMDERAACIMIHAQNGLVVDVVNNTFIDDAPCFFTYKRQDENYPDSPFVADPSTITYNVGANKWQTIPESIANATYYNVSDQQQID